MERRDYNAAVQALNSLQSNHAIVKAIRDSGRSLNERAIPEMVEWLRKVGYVPSDLDALRPVHVAGTKGKGSTSAFISSILAQYSASLPKVGLYTSPHLRSVRERIQINNEPISEQLFSRYFFEVWDRLSAIGDGSKPGYFRFLTLVAFHAFLQERIDTAVIECGIGGEYDSTNLLVSPTVTAVTALGIDHVGMLGNTIEEIAWHKAGIFKNGALAFTVPQREAAMRSLLETAQEKGVRLKVVERDPQIASGDVKLGLAADFQKSNASLAVAVCQGQLQKLGIAVSSEPSPEDGKGLPPEFRRGLELVKWPGRCEKRVDTQSNVVWCLDGGHTLESIEVAGVWFAEEAPNDQKSGSNKIPDNVSRILIFNQQTRDAPSLARALFKTLSAVLGPHPFSNVIFTTNITFENVGYKPDLVAANNNGEDIRALKVQKELALVWTEMDKDAETKVTPTIEAAVEEARRVAQQAGGGDNAEVMCLITGSLHLVGGALEVLEGARVN